MDGTRQTSTAGRLLVDSIFKSMRPEEAFTSPPGLKKGGFFIQISISGSPDGKEHQKKNPPLQVQKKRNTWRSRNKNNPRTPIPNPSKTFQTSILRQMSFGSRSPRPRALAPRCGLRASALASAPARGFGEVAPRLRGGVGGLQRHRGTSAVGRASHGHGQGAQEGGFGGQPPKHCTSGIPQSCKPVACLKEDLAGF